jgi:tRNA(Ile)-lysidine synthase
VPGRAAYGDGEIACELGAGPLDADALAGALDVRSWQPGDRVRARGATRTLQDLFTNGKVPRERRAQLPVVLSAGEVAWVPGVVTGERFAATAATRRRARLVWS